MPDGWTLLRRHQQVLLQLAIKFIARPNVWQRWREISEGLALVDLLKRNRAS